MKKKDFVLYLLLAVSLCLGLYNLNLNSIPKNTSPGFTYNNSDLDNLGDRLLFLENKFSNIDFFPVENVTIPSVNLSCILVQFDEGRIPQVFDYVGTNFYSSSSIVKDGSDWIEENKPNYEHIFYGVQCIQDNGWVMISGSTSEILIKEINGELGAYDDSFIADNGFFARRGTISMVCCKTITN